MNYCDKCGDVKVCDTCLRCTYGEIAATAMKDLEFTKTFSEAMFKKLRAQRDERQALLEYVFGENCKGCDLNQDFFVEGSYSTFRCTIDGRITPQTGRLSDCPFLPFEPKKVSLKPVDEIFAKYMSPEEMRQADEEADKETK